MSKWITDAKEYRKSLLSKHGGELPKEIISDEIECAFIAGCQSERNRRNPFPLFNGNKQDNI